MEKKILIVCGEASGDLYASCLARELLRLNPRIKISGVGGNLSRQAGVEVFCDIKELAVFGLFDVLKKLPKFLALKKLILEKIEQEQIDAIIFIDFGGFNLRLAKAIDKKIKTFYYISPQVWASREGRVKTIKDYIDRLIVIFKFEEEFYKKLGINATFVGHPLLDIVKPETEKREFAKKYGLIESKTTVALLPGSRKSEIKNILPVMLETCEILKKELKEIQFVIAKSTQVDMEIYNNIISGYSLEVKTIEGKTYDTLNIADFSLVCSGTATLETTLMQKPFVIIYKMSPLNYFLYRPQVKVPYIGMVNIVAGKLIVPEFIQFRATAENIARKVLAYLKNPSELESMKRDLTQVSSSLGQTGATLRAAQTISSLLS